MFVQILWKSVTFKLSQKNYSFACFNLLVELSISRKESRVKEIWATLLLINLLSAISICSRQFQFYSRQFQFAHGNFNLPTAISICSRQFQFTHGNSNLLTAISIYPRQFQFVHACVRSRQDAYFEALHS